MNKNKALKHFEKVDKVFFGSIQKLDLDNLESKIDNTKNKNIKDVSILVYQSLISSIISQQISVKAAESIKLRFLKLFKNNYPTPKTLIRKLNNGEEDFVKTKQVGLSSQKINYIKNVAEFWTKNNLDAFDFKNTNNEKIIELLTEIKGVGKWTVEMLLMFTLNRGDVFSLGDGGLQNGIIKIYNIDKNKLTKKELESIIKNITDNLSPYRSFASLCVWRIKDSK